LITDKQVGSPHGNPSAHDGEAGIATDQTDALPSGPNDQAFILEAIHCGRKLFHRNIWTAILHVRHLGGSVRVYLCHCGGFHVGHAPSHERTREYRRSRKRLRAIDRRLIALDQEWLGLMLEKKALLVQAGQPDVLGPMISEITEQVRRLAKLMKLWTRT
jgi:hypothetical protein